MSTRWFCNGAFNTWVGGKNNSPAHPVILTKGFYVGKFEVTQREYEKVMGKNPSKFKGEKLPVEMVSWNDAVEFCQASNR